MRATLLINADHPNMRFVATDGDQLIAGNNPDPAVERSIRKILPRDLDTGHFPDALDLGFQLGSVEQRLDGGLRIRTGGLGERKTGQTVACSRGRSRWDCLVVGPKPLDGVLNHLVVLVGPLNLTEQLVRQESREILSVVRKFKCGVVCLDREPREARVPAHTAYGRQDVRTNLSTDLYGNRRRRHVPVESFQVPTQGPRRGERGLVAVLGNDKMADGTDVVSYDFDRYRRWSWLLRGAAGCLSDGGRGRRLTQKQTAAGANDGDYE